MHTFLFYLYFFFTTMYTFTYSYLTVTYLIYTYVYVSPFFTSLRYSTFTLPLLHVAQEEQQKRREETEQRELLARQQWTDFAKLEVRNKRLLRPCEGEAEGRKLG
jgi:hypothetical protein